MCSIQHEATLLRTKQYNMGIIECIVELLYILEIINWNFKEI